MKLKNILRTLLLFFVFASLVFLGYREYRGPDREATAVNTESGMDITGGPPAKIIAYYFHGNIRCESCRNIEHYAEMAIREAFAEELKNGKLEWRIVNVQEPGNKHFMDDYRLSFWSLVIVEIREGRQERWKNLQRVWDLVGDPDAFGEYVRGEISAFIEDGRA